VRTGTLRLLSAVLILLAAASAAPNAAGLFDDPRSFFPCADTTRTVVTVNQAEFDLENGGASLLGVEARIRRGARTRIALAAQFPIVRSPGDIACGMGDFFVSASVRLAGDSLDASGLYLGAFCRAPTGSRTLAPFSHASLDGSLGCEARGRVSALSARAAARYTLVGERPRDGVHVHDRHATLAGSISVDVPRLGSAAACAVWTGYAGGAARRSLCLSLAVDLSEAFMLVVSAAAESGSGGAASYERMAGISLSYRFPARAAPPSPAPQTS
jgi:hypothetical protein